MDDAIFFIKEKTFDKILNYAHCAKNEFKSEIGGMCVILKDNDGNYELIDPVILKQTISGGNCDLDKDELAVYYTKVDQKYNKYDYTFCWWHSHHTMGAFWSKTDTDTMEEASDSNISYSLVVSWNEDPYGHIFRVSYWKPVVYAKDIKLEIIHKREKKIPKSIMKEVEEKCSSPIPTNSKYANNLMLKNPNTGYSYYRRGYQSNLFNTNTYNLDPTATYGVILDLVDKLMNKLINGTLVYHDYVAEIDEINEQLGEDNPISVTKEAKATIDRILINTASDYVEYDLTKDDDEMDDMEAINTIEGNWQ